MPLCLLGFLLVTLCPFCGTWYPLLWTCTLMFLFLYWLIFMAPFIWWDRYLFYLSLFWLARHLYRLVGLRTLFVSKVLFFGQTVIYWTVNLIGPLVLGPGPYDDSFIHWTVNFLALAFSDRHCLGLSLDVLTSLLVRQFLRHGSYDDSSSIGPSAF